MISGGMDSTSRSSRIYGGGHLIVPAFPTHLPCEAFVKAISVPRNIKDTILKMIDFQGSITAVVLCPLFVSHGLVHKRTKSLKVHKEIF
jgi:hypothetical protein